MGQVSALIGAQRAAAAGVVRPTEDAGFKEGTIDNQLPAALERIQQAYLAPGPVERVILSHRQPWHLPAFGGQSVTRAGQVLLLHQELLSCSLPLLLRYDLRCFHRLRSCVLHFLCCHRLFSVVGFWSFVLDMTGCLLVMYKILMQLSNDLGVTSVAGFLW